MPLRLLAELRNLLEADNGLPQSHEASASAAAAAKPARQRRRRTAASASSDTSDQPALPIVSFSAPSMASEQGRQLNGADICMALQSPLQSGAAAETDTIGSNEAVHVDEWSQMMASSIAKARERIWGSTAAHDSDALASAAGLPPSEGINAQPAASSTVEPVLELAGVSAAESSTVNGIEAGQPPEQLPGKRLLTSLLQVPAHGLRESDAAPSTGFKLEYALVQPATELSHLFMGVQSA